MPLKENLYRIFKPHIPSDLDSEVRKILSRTSTTPDESTKSIEDKVKKWSSVLSSLSMRFGRMTTGNMVHVFKDGTDTFTDMLNSINQAKKRVWIEVYILDGSSASDLFIKTLKNAAKRGCNVILLVDYGGSMWYKGYDDELRSSGVNLLYFNTISDPLLPFAYRNHKKLLLIDDDTAYCGSMNIGGSSLDDSPGGFYDIHVKVKGPSFYDLAESFLMSLKMTGYNGPLLKLTHRPQPLNDGVIVQVLESNMPKHKKDIQSAMITTLSKASHSIHLSTSYFTPPGSLRRALLAAKRRNLNFRLLLSGNSDLFGDDFVTHHVLRKFFRRTIINKPNPNFKVYMTQNKHFHGKAIVIDDLWSSLGSFNWDRLSSRRNMEVNLGIFDPNVACKLRDVYKNSSLELREYTRLDSINRPKILKLFDFITYHINKFGGGNLFDGLSNDGYKISFKKTFMRTFIDVNISDLIILSNLSGV